MRLILGPLYNIYLHHLSKFLQGLYYNFAINIRSIIIIPFFFALSLSLLPGEVAYTNMPPKATLATFKPSIEQISKTSSSKMSF